MFSRKKIALQTAALAFALILTLGIAQNALATITVAGVTGASNVIDLTGTTPTVFGGTAGASGVGDCAAKTSTSTCNNCYDNGFTNDTRFLACNPARIHSTLQLSFTLSSDTVESGRPAITDTDDNALALVGTPATVTKGQQGTVSILWPTVCDEINVDSTGDDTVCEPAENDKYSGNIKVGIDKDGDGKLNGTGDESKTISVVVHRGFVSTPGTFVSTIDDCSGPTLLDFMGVCEFDVLPGDEKVKVQSLEAAANFPASTGIKFSNVLFFLSDVGFGDITPASTFISLPVESDDTTTFALSSDRVTGLSNETRYWFKAAVQDQAMNISYFTSDTRTDGRNVDCFTNGGVAPCHSARPGEVLGVLTGDTNCFIATAAFGSAMAPQVKTFRKFRDTFLSPSRLGRVFVRGYYEIGPRFAKVIARSEWLRAGARVGLLPALGYAWLSLKIGLSGALAVLALLASVPVLVLAYRRRSRASRS